MYHDPRGTKEFSKSLLEYLFIEWLYKNSIDDGFYTEDNTVLTKTYGLFYNDESQQIYMYFEFFESFNLF